MKKLLTAILILIGAFTKSAQFPFHFWLPNAMTAPTPISAFLHSATMVKAGIYLLARLHPILGATSAWMGTLVLTGGITALLGSVLAMQASVSDWYATRLAGAFYAGLCTSETPLASRALADARREVEQERDVETDERAAWEAVLVLYKNDDAVRKEAQTALAGLR